MSILDLPIERQKQIAIECGYTDFEKWQEDMRKHLEETDAFIKALDEYKPSKAEIAEKIKRLQENPDTIHYYRRIYDEYDLTVEEMIDCLRKCETRD